MDEMNPTQQVPPTPNDELQALVKKWPLVLGTFLGVVLGPGVVKWVGEISGWGTYSLAATFVASILMGGVGALLGVTIEYFEKRLKD